jgi:hypothetical protein
VSQSVSREHIRNLPTTELGVALIRYFAATSPDQANLYNLMVQAQQDMAHETGREELLAKLSDAVAWIQAHGLVGPVPGGGSWERLTADGRRLAKDNNGLAWIAASERLAGSLDRVLDQK